mgnify:CR=1 FL=1
MELPTAFLQRICVGRLGRVVAEGEGFEPPEPCGSPVFKTGTFGHSVTPPQAILR